MDALIPAKSPDLGHSTDLWALLQTVAPEITEVVHAGDFPETQAPGLKAWLLSQFALNTPTNVIRNDLDQMVADQEADGAPSWPLWSKRRIDQARNRWRDDWTPLTVRLEEGIAQVGVLAKNRRLLALQALYERLAEVVWEERSTKTNQLYLLGELRATLHQIAEEKGELGEQGIEAIEVLGDLAKGMALMLGIQGSGIQEADRVVPEEAYFDA